MPKISSNKFDCLFCAGVTALTLGIGMQSVPWAVIILGLVLMIVACLGARSE